MPVSDKGPTDIGDKMYNNGIPPPYSIEILEDVGWATAVALLDIIQENPLSRIEQSNFKNLSGIWEDIKWGILWAKGEN